MNFDLCRQKLVYLAQHLVRLPGLRDESYLCWHFLPPGQYAPRSDDRCNSWPPPPYDPDEFETIKLTGHLNVCQKQPHDRKGFKLTKRLLRTVCRDHNEA